MDKAGVVTMNRTGMTRRAVIGAALGGTLSGLVHAAPPLLIVDGAVRGGTPGGDGRLRKEFSEADILAMTAHTIKTSTSWRPLTDFVGPRLQTVLKAAGADLTASSRIQLTALNEYAVIIPAADLDRYNPVLAHTVGGKRLPRREFGPLWLMYPRDDFEELRNNVSTDSKLIWQVIRITVL